MPKRIPEQVVHFSACEPYACIDGKNLSVLLHNHINTEAYIKQLENLLHSTSEPVKP